MSPENSIRHILNETYMPTNKPPRDPHVLIHVPDPPPRDPHALIHVPDSPPRDPELIDIPENNPILKPKSKPTTIPVASPKNPTYPPSRLPANVMKGLGDRSYMKPEPKKLGENIQMNKLQAIQEAIMNMMEVHTPAEVQARMKQTNPGEADAAAQLRADRLGAVAKVWDRNRRQRGKAAEILGRAGIDPRSGAEHQGSMIDPKTGKLTVGGRSVSEYDGSKRGDIGATTYRDMVHSRDAHTNRGIIVPPRTPSPISMPDQEAMDRLHHASEPHVPQDPEDMGKPWWKRI